MGPSSVWKRHCASKSLYRLKSPDFRTYEYRAMGRLVWTWGFLLTPGCCSNQWLIFNVSIAHWTSQHSSARFLLAPPPNLLMFWGSFHLSPISQWRPLPSFAARLRWHSTSLMETSSCDAIASKGFLSSLGLATSREQEIRLYCWTKWSKLELEE
jgi:hypothetical protein